MICRFTLIILSISSWHFGFAQSNGITFTVCDLAPMDYEFSKTSFAQELEKRCGNGIEAWSKEPDNLISTNFHPLVETVHKAYATHRPLILSPDMIWLLIAQGFAKHIDQNSESLRHYFVNFKDKKVLKVQRDDFIKGSPQNKWEEVFPEFARQIEEYTGKELLSTTVLQFSTTGKTEKAAFEVTLMDAMSSYFIYAVYTSCGIPQITLEGTTNDWELLLEKAKKLEQYDLKWWTDELIPILEKFVDASKGNVDNPFWEDIYKTKSMGSGTPSVSGWLIKFFPYILEKKTIIRNNHFNDYILTTNFTSGISKADFYWIYFRPPAFQMEFHAGFVGIEENPTTLALRPVIGWAIKDTGVKGVKKGDEKYEDDIYTFPGCKQK